MSREIITSKGSENLFSGFSSLSFLNLEFSRRLDQRVSLEVALMRRIFRRNFPSPSRNYRWAWILQESISRLPRLSRSIMSRKSIWKSTAQAPIIWGFTSSRAHIKPKQIKLKRAKYEKITSQPYCLIRVNWLWSSTSEDLGKGSWAELCGSVIREKVGSEWETTTGEINGSSTSRVCVSWAHQLFSPQLPVVYQSLVLISFRARSWTETDSSHFPWRADPYRFVSITMSQLECFFTFFTFSVRCHVVVQVNVTRHKPR